MKWFEIGEIRKRITLYFNFSNNLNLIYYDHLVKIFLWFRFLSGNWFGTIFSFLRVDEVLDVNGLAGARRPWQDERLVVLQQELHQVLITKQIRIITAYHQFSNTFEWSSRQHMRGRRVKNKFILSNKHIYLGFVLLNDSLLNKLYSSNSIFSWKP